MSNETEKFFDRQGMAITETTKQKLFHAAVELFAKRGYDGASVRDITRGVGIKESSFYNHFASKDELLLTMYSEFLNFMKSTNPPIELVDEVVRSSEAEDLLRKRTENYWSSSIHTDIGKMWFTISMEQYRDRRAGELVVSETERMIGMHAVLFSKMMEHGKIPSSDPETVSGNFVFAMRAYHLDYLVRFVHGFETKTIEKRTEDFITFFIGKLKGEGQ